MLVALLRAGTLGLDLARGRAKAAASRIARQAALGAATLLFVLLAFSFGLAAFSVWLAHEIGTVPALGFIGLGFLVVAGIILAVAVYGDRKPAKPPPIIPAAKAAVATRKSIAAHPTDSAIPCTVDVPATTPRADQTAKTPAMDSGRLLAMWRVRRSCHAAATSRMARAIRDPV